MTKFELLKDRKTSSKNVNNAFYRAVHKVKTGIEAVKAFESYGGNKN